MRGVAPHTQTSFNIVDRKCATALARESPLYSQSVSASKCL